jgi:hypothetical protein
VDGRDKPGHDQAGWFAPRTRCPVPPRFARGR